MVGRRDLEQEDGLQKTGLNVHGNSDYSMEDRVKPKCSKNKKPKPGEMGRWKLSFSYFSDASRLFESSWDNKCKREDVLLGVNEAFFQSYI